MRITVPGPLYPITISFVTYKTLCKHAKHTNKNQIIKGVFLAKSNDIYVDKSLPKDEKLHVVFHELEHASDYMLSNMDEEARVDARATWDILLIEDRTIIDLIKAAL